MATQTQLQATGADNSPATTQPDEVDRLAALYRTGLLDSEPSESFDRVTRLTARTLRVPTVLVSLVDESRQWFKSRFGCDTQETDREISFCTHTVAKREPLIVPDAMLDPRFAANPLVCGPPYMRAYLGIPLFARDGHAIGALCAIDQHPRNFDGEDLAAMTDFGRIAEDAIHAYEALRRRTTSQGENLRAEAARQTKQLQVENDALRLHIKRLMESERAARATEKRLRSIANGLPVMIGYWNRHLYCEFANQEFDRWFGIPLDQMVGMTMPEVLGELFAGVEGNVQLALEGHAQRFQRLQLRRPSDGAPVSLEVRYVPELDDAGKVRGFYSLVTDITPYQPR
jgi:PAS domain S-box-containing protein